mgnify:CR=1 FL=1
MKITKFIAAVAAMAPIPATVLAQGAAETVTTGPDSGDTAWMLVATALVAFMILPGIALFYGGLVRAKNALSILTQTAIIAAVVTPTPDPVNMMIVMIPLYLLYEVGVILARFARIGRKDEGVAPRRARSKD